MKRTIRGIGDRTCAGACDSAAECWPSPRRSPRGSLARPRRSTLAAEWDADSRAGNRERCRTHPVRRSVDGVLGDVGSPSRRGTGCDAARCASDVAEVRQEHRPIPPRHPELCPVPGIGCGSRSWLPCPQAPADEVLRQGRQGARLHRQHDFRWRGAQPYLTAVVVEDFQFCRRTWHDEPVDADKRSPGPARRRSARGTHRRTRTPDDRAGARRLIEVSDLHGRVDGGHGGERRPESLLVADPERVHRTQLTRTSARAAVDAACSSSSSADIVASVMRNAAMARLSHTPW